MTNRRIKPILFSAPMIRAILDGRKTQSRRVLKPQPEASPHADGNEEWLVKTDQGLLQLPTEEMYGAGQVPTPYDWGDLLWVRESIKFNPEHDNFYFAADGKGCGTEIYNKLPHRSRPSIYMPRWASRITLEVTDVKVERVQEITEEAAIAEGARTLYGEPYRSEGNGLTERRRFQLLWNHLNAKRGFGWDENPWIVATTFKPHIEHVNTVKDRMDSGD